MWKLKYCKAKLNEYLNYLKKYIPEYLHIKYKRKEEIIKQYQIKMRNKKLLKNYICYFEVNSLSM